MRAIDIAREFERLDVIRRAADFALLGAMRKARAAGVSEKKLFSHPDVHAATLAHGDTISDLATFAVANCLDLFGDPKKPGTGPYGEIRIIDVPRRERGR